MKPTITNFSPKGQKPGEKVVITGTGFTGVTRVLFGGADALFFSIVSDNTIEAYPNFSGTSLITAINPDGSGSLSGFTLIASKIKLPMLPDLGRVPNDDDQIYIWNNQTGILSRTTIDNLPAGTGGGGSGGGAGGVYTALGAPFKVRVGDDNIEYDSTTDITTINDVRLLGKDDVVVFASDLNSELEDWDQTTDTGSLDFNGATGVLKIHHYQLTPGRHLTITVDGVVSTAFNDYLKTAQARLAAYDKLLAPIKQTQGICLPWRFGASTIPAGWQRVTDFNGKILVGQDPSDTAGDTNPNPLNGAPNTGSGERFHGITKDDFDESFTVNIEQTADERTENFGLSINGQGFQKRVLVAGKNDGTGSAAISLGGNGRGLDKLPAYKIVIWIEYIG